MKQKKYTKRALCMSILSLLLCCSMLVGTTFAWFTDSVTSGKNQIVAGNLDVELEYAPAGTEITDGKIADTAWQKVTADVNLFKPAEGDGATLWEPGHTEYVYLRVRNAGSLALKYSLTANVFGANDGKAAENEYTNIEGEKFKLSNYLVFRDIDGVKEYKSRNELWMTDKEEEEKAMGKLENIGKPNAILYPVGTEGHENESERIFTLAVYMPTSVGNVANWGGKTEGEPNPPEIYLGLDLKASQVPYESDSFGTDYDDAATDEDGNVITISSMSSTPTSGAPTVFYFSGNAPAEDKSTTVEFKEEALEAGKKVELILETGKTPAAESKPNEDGFAPIDFLDLTLLVDGVEYSYNDPTKPITISTYVEPGMKNESLHVYFEQEDGTLETPEKDYKVSYDSETGLLTMETTHLSKYLVYKELKGYTLMAADKLKTKMWNGSQSGSMTKNDKTLQKVVFCRYDEETVGKAWKDGTDVGETSKDEVKLFLKKGEPTAYICVQPDVDVLYLPENCSYMFYQYDALTTVEFDNTLISAMKVKNMDGMFRNSKITKLDLGGWDTPNLTRMYWTFFDCDITSLDVTGWDVSHVTTMDSLFCVDGHLTEIKGLETWNTENVTDMSSMFKSCSALQTLDLTGWDVSKVKEMEKMFSFGYSSKMTEIKGLETWNPASVTTMEEMFATSTNLQTIGDISGWDTSNVTTMKRMFQDCYALTAVNPSGWNVSKVTTMEEMFNSCSKLTELDLSGWSTDSLTNTTKMFYNSSKIETIYVGDGWNLENVTKANSNNMFNSCGMLRGEKGTYVYGRLEDGSGKPDYKKKDNPQDKTYARIDGGPDSETPGYFTAK